MSRKNPAGQVPVSQAARRLAALVRQLADEPSGRIALTVRGEVRAYLVAAPPADEDAGASRKVRSLVRRALKAARG